LQIHAIGPNANTDVCPENDRVGEFRDNHGHSCGRYALRIFHNMIPRERPCAGISYDENEPDDPWHSNRPITANFYGFTGWANNRNGAIANKVGDVRFINFKVADNLLAGIEFEITDSYGKFMAGVDNALVVGHTNNTSPLLEAATSRGIIAPRSDNFFIQNSRFYNWDWGESAAFGSCSHCFHTASTDSGSRTATVKNITLDETVTRTFNYGYPDRAIFEDLDGSVTGLGAGSWATVYYPHHMVPECEHREEHGGVFCDNTVQIRRVAWANSVPSGLFRGMFNYAVLYDDELFLENGGELNRTEYLEDAANYGKLEWRKKLKPSASWPTPFVTGHKYKIHWGTGLDFEEMVTYMSKEWLPTDKSIYLVHNFTDVRAQVDVHYKNGTG